MSSSGSLVRSNAADSHVTPALSFALSKSEPRRPTQSAARTFITTLTLERNENSTSPTLLPHPQRSGWFGLGEGRRQASFSLASSGSPVRSDEADFHATPTLSFPLTKSEPRRPTQSAARTFNATSTIERNENCISSPLLPQHPAEEMIWTGRRKKTSVTQLGFFREPCPKRRSGFLRDTRSLFSLTKSESRRPTQSAAQTFNAHQH